MAQEASVQTLIITGSWMVRVFDSSGQEIKPRTLLIEGSGHFEVGQLPSKAIIAIIEPEDDYDAYRVRLYCYNNGAMRLVGATFISNPLDDISNHVRDALVRCQ